MIKIDECINMPYNKCLTCDYLGNGCDGPRTSSMTIEKWCEWLRNVKAAKRLTNAEISEISGVSIATVARVMAGNVDKDIMRSSSAALENAIIGSSDKYPCYLAFMESVPDATKALVKTLKELELLRTSHDNMVKSHAEAIRAIREEVRVIREDAQERIDYLKTENERLHGIIDKLMEK